MSRILLSVPLVLATATAPSAEIPRVAVDIAPVHSLVARVMQGVGEPDLIIPPGASPHEYQLRPSEAAALQEAEVVVWIGEDLTPWLEDPLESLAGDAAHVSLLDADGVTLLDFRENALFEAHSHGDDDHGSEDHDHDHAEAHDHDDHDHAEHAHDDHDHDHGHGAHDPHAWLSPDNAATWLNVIAGRLSVADPANAGAYFANAEAGRAEIETLKTEIAAILEPVREGRFIAFHDAYQYFETAFDIPAAGAISISDASDPSPARIAEIQTRIRDEGIDCVLAEPQFNAQMVATVMVGTDASTGVLDPLGSDLEPGPALYPQLMRNLAETLAGCL
ncbi:zinc ABC transporter substrate-binding protein [Jannaschia aquimarina]|uniref:High-affinity zinc uptake system protein ZnuA n=1 Tax=Jannaschia aquimarina TaxID=935700 RepID=A0A0D1D746_9RHOB|nr:zinc ABC transporter substrate-binding protein [Jannaschia aquimarina]KIT15763.1 High-affinity zinc uptake system protein ZnuA precursor [Jannaschia aquimarina]SNT31850.1 zinc transport system substrate-binding protein [Jannaschia aquimarina]